MRNFNIIFLALSALVFFTRSVISVPTLKVFAITPDPFDNCEFFSYFFGVALRKNFSGLQDLDEKPKATTTSTTTTLDDLELLNFSEDSCGKKHFFAEIS